MSKRDGRQLADRMYINEAHRQIFAATSAIEGWQHPEDSEALFEMGYRSGDVILEVGTYAGRSAVCMIAGALSAGRSPKYYGVDISPVAIEMTRATLTTQGYMRRALLYEGTLASFALRYPIAPTAVFVDGGHEYEDVKADIEVLRTFITSGTPVIFHDYNNMDAAGVSKAVREAGDLQIVAEPGCSAVTRLIGAGAERVRRPSSARFAVHRLSNYLSKPTEIFLHRVRTRAALIIGRPIRF